MAEMYVWEVRLEVEWEYTKKHKSGTSKTWKDTDSDERFTVAAPSGLKAIEVAKRVALDKLRNYTDDWSDVDETVSAKPIKVLDVFGLELKETLDG